MFVCLSWFSVCLENKSRRSITEALRVIWLKCVYVSVCHNSHIWEKENLHWFEGDALGAKAPKSRSMAVSWKRGEGDLNQQRWEERWGLERKNKINVNPRCSFLLLWWSNASALEPLNQEKKSHINPPYPSKWNIYTVPVHLSQELQKQLQWVKRRTALKRRLDKRRVEWGEIAAERDRMESG